MDEPKSAEILLHPSAKSWNALACLDKARQALPKDCSTAIICWYDEANNVRFISTGTNRDIAYMLNRLTARLVR